MTKQEAEQQRDKAVGKLLTAAIERGHGDGSDEQVLAAADSYYDGEAAVQYAAPPLHG